ncbi:MAG TPA: AAA domain-containing protein [Thermoflexia bacterium]|nr:AAA domain-containing protein [Thermoflexia bacterium]
MNVDILIARFQQYYGHTNFRDEQFTEWEYTYKKERGQQMREEWLSREALERLIGAEDWSEICQRVARSFAMEGPLARWDEYQWVRELDPEEQRSFSLTLWDFLYGEKPFVDRLERFVREATEVYHRFHEKDPVRQRRYRSRKLSWPFVSYFHFMMWPDREYPFIKPSPLQKAARAVGFDIRYHAQPNAETYERVREFYRALWPTVQRLGGRDWIDVQTLIHVAGGGFGVPEGGWIDERGQRAATDFPPTVGKIVALLRRKPQVILQGAPGTGKTYTALLVAAAMLGLGGTDAGAVRQPLREYQLATLLEEDPALADAPTRLAERVRAGGRGLWEIVQLHPSYTYEDFVRGLQAEPTDGRILFRTVNRVLGLLAETAAALTSDRLPVVLILDEINRGDLSKVLGELIYSLEYREEAVLTPYAVDGRPDLSLPPNLYLLGTMNTADRSIALVDYAIRRRFYFVTLRPDRDVIIGHYRDDPLLAQRAVALFDAVAGLFEGLHEVGYSPYDLMVGHTYFLADGPESLALKFAYDVVPLLREYLREGLLDDVTIRLEDGRIDLAQASQKEVAGRVRAFLEGKEKDGP